MDKLEHVKQLAEESKTQVHVRASMMGDIESAIATIGDVADVLKPPPTTAPANGNGVPQMTLGPPPPPPVNIQGFPQPQATAAAGVFPTWPAPGAPQTAPLGNGDQGQYPVPWVPPSDTVPQSIPGAAGGIIAWLFQTLGRQGAEMAIEALKEYFGRPGNGFDSGLVSKPECNFIYNKLSKPAKVALDAYWCGIKFPFGLSESEAAYFWTIMVSQQEPPRQECCPQAFTGGRYCPIY